MYELMSSALFYHFAQFIIIIKNVMDGLNK